MQKITAASKTKYMWGKLLYNTENKNKPVLTQRFGFLDYLHIKEWCKQMVWVPNQQVCNWKWNLSETLFFHGGVL